MKFDKEIVLKHKFWFLLVVSLPLSIGAIFLLVTTVSGDINRNREKIEKELANNQKQLANNQFLAKAPEKVVEGLRRRGQELHVLQEKSQSKLKELGC